MGVLRALFYVLVVLNLGGLGLLALPWLGVASPLQGITEPERLSEQLDPEKLNISQLHSASTPAAEAVINVAQQSVSTSSHQAETSSSATSSTTSSESQKQDVAQANSNCLALINLSATQTQSLTQLARKTSEALSVREEAAQPSSYWVNIPPLGGKEGAEKRAAELRALGLEDFFVVQEASENRYAISLGLFKGESLAQRLLETLQKRGVKGATITARRNPNGARIEVSGDSALLDTFRQSLGKELNDVQREACK